MEMEKETNKNYLTQQIWIKKGYRMYGYFQKMTQNAKNIYNTTNFFIRQIYTGLTQDKEKEIKCHLFEKPSKKTPYMDYNKG